MNMQTQQSRHTSWSALSLATAGVFMSVRGGVESLNIQISKHQNIEKDYPVLAASPWRCYV